jgi:hypothetical protein
VLRVVPGGSGHNGVSVAQPLREVPLVRQNNDRIDSALPRRDEFLKTSRFGVVWKFGDKASVPNLVGVMIQAFPFILLSPKGGMKGLNPRLGRSASRLSEEVGWCVGSSISYQLQA